LEVETLTDLLLHARRELEDTKTKLDDAKSAFPPIGKASGSEAEITTLTALQNHIRRILDEAKMKMEATKTSGTQ